ncbi:hypothetical protein QOT19_23575 [Serratia marcescens]|uniref:hypothetical protein n=1 Tax=Serratia marcescens TaxID=615 RepID=UPI0027314D81|nr:hypothetical protein [Serratia marcescens]MDP0522307.1 hypothetical protein [Serratia marcescens]
MQIQQFFSQTVVLSVPILFVLYLVTILYLKRNAASFLCFLSYLVLAAMSSVGIYHDQELWSGNPQVTLAIAYGSTLAAVFMLFICMLIFAMRERN